MASSSPTSASINPDTLITVKVIVDGNNRRFKLALRDLTAHALPDRLRGLLNIPPEAELRLERYSDSAGAYVTLDSSSPSVYKQLYRAAKAKLKLRIKVTVNKPLAKLPENIMDQPPPATEQKSNETMEARPSYLETVLAPSTYQSPEMADSNGTIKNDSTENLISGPKVQIASLPVGSAPSVTWKRSDHSGPNAQRFLDLPAGHFCIDCNHCGQGIQNEHYHCSICDNGDYDLCMDCIDSQVNCGEDGHWLIKRSFKDGKLISGTTETIAPKKPCLPDDESKPEPAATDFGDRVCNCCISDCSSEQLVTCLGCPDFDLCYSCLLSRTHGHDPSHQLKPINDGDKVFQAVSNLCQPGRDTRHAAVCDGCDKNIFGVRHKCLVCPDWDFCDDCVSSASEIHPGHRFVALYKPITDPLSTCPSLHFGIFCDGPLCQNKSPRSYIRGDRFKCAVCNDTDFCANCEAHPNHRHNRTHPLIKFKTPVRNVSVTTLGEKGNGELMAPMGDKVKHTTTASVNSTNAATQVQEPETKPAPEPEVVVQKPIESFFQKTSTSVPELQAKYVSDTITDGSQMKTNVVFEQTWTLYNPGPLTWPVGSSVRYIGGDGMLNVSPEHPSSVDVLTAAMESNVLAREVQPGDSADFTVKLRTPQREGKAISYWRLKTAEGVAFGHKLWCDVNVVLERASDTTIESEVETPVKEEPVLEASSTMIFPQLEKESPSSSVHNVSLVAKGESMTPAEVPSASTEEAELVDEIESLELDEEDETDDGFLTDEEYDILDASDEDLLAEAQKTNKKA